jgi:hypothetical protein
MVLGGALATVKIAGKTPWQHMLRAWHSPAAESRMEAVRNATEDALDQVKDQLQGRRSMPREHLSPDDRRALHQLLVSKTHPSP